MTATEDNPVSHKYDVTGSKTFIALSDKLGESFHTSSQKGGSLSASNLSSLDHKLAATNGFITLHTFRH
jgi:hypothetical protein